jgi:hypothetical protein
MCPSCQLIASDTGALIAAVSVIALLVARVNVPLLALVSIYAGARVIGNFLPNWAGAGTTLKGWSTGELAAKRGAQRI